MLWSVVTWLHCFQSLHGEAEQHAKEHVVQKSSLPPIRYEIESKRKGGQDALLKWFAFFAKASFQ